MKFQYIPYIWPLIVSSAITLYLGIYALLKRKSAKGAISFIFSMFLVTIWSLGNALEMATIDLDTKLFWANIQYFAYCYSPITLLALCMEFTGYDEWTKPKKFWRFLVIPTIIIILVWTNDLHGMIRQGIYMDYSGSFPVVAKRYGPMFFVHAFYSHLINIIAWVLITKAVVIKNTVYRKQAFALFLGLSLIVIPNMLYISGISPVKRFDITPTFFGPAGLIMTWGIFRYKMFDLIPLARATVIETMEAGVLVYDLQNRIMDMNPAFSEILGLKAGKLSAKKVEEACSKIPELAKACIDRNITNTEFSINDDGYAKNYEAMFSPLSDNKGNIIGRLAVIYDITEKKQSQKELLKQQWELAVTAERERMVKDMHDNLSQVLGFINLQAQGIRQELLNAGVEVASGKLDRLVDVTQDAHNEIREYIHNARSEVFREKDFITALHKEITKFENRTGIHVKLEIPDGFTGEKLEPITRLNIFNIIKEALNNVGKHAEVDNARVCFSIEAKVLCVIIEDYGKGFDSSICKEPDKHYGLKIMRERVAEIGAQLDIQSSSEEGSRIILHLPLKEV